MNEHHCVELLGGYALGALDEHDEERVVSHVRICVWCRQEAERITDCVHTAMGYNVRPAAPGPHVRARLLTRLAEETAALGAMALPPDAVVAETAINPNSAIASATGTEIVHSPTHGAPPRREVAPDPAPFPLPARLPDKAAALTAAPNAPRMLRPRWVVSVALVAAALILGLGVGLVNMRQQLDNQRAHLLSDAFSGAHAAMPLDGPAIKHGMRGEVIMRPGESTGLVIVSGVPTSSGKMIYTCWLHQNGHWMAGGNLHPDASGIAMVVLNHDMNVHKADQVAITMEYANRTPISPSKPMLLSVAL